MAQRRLNKKRPVISVSLDPEDYDWIQGLEGSSDSFKASRIIRAARLAGLTIDDAVMPVRTLVDFRDWLKTQRGKTELSAELLELLSQFLDQ